jgi:hypothetical protein
MTLRLVRILCLAFLAVLLSACAFGTRRVTLSYPPPAASYGLVKEAVAAGGAADQGKVSIVTFTDVRGTPLIGDVRNGYGMHTADVVTDTSISEWSTNALDFELRQRGYAVSVVQSVPTGPDDLWVSGQVVEVYCHAMFNYEGKVGALARIGRGAATISERRYDGEGSAGLNLAAYSGSYGDSLGLALQAVVKQIADAIEAMPEPTPTLAPVTSPAP